MVGETGLQGWPVALLARWVGVAGRGCFFPPRVSEPPGLQEGMGHYDIRACRVKPNSGPALEAVQAQFLCEFLMDLLANPPRLNHASESLGRGIGGDTGKIVLALAIRAMLSYQQCFLARHVPGSDRADPLGCTIGKAHVHDGKAGGRRAFAPRQLTRRYFARSNMAWAAMDFTFAQPHPGDDHALRAGRSTARRLGNLLTARDPHLPAKATRAQSLPK